MAKPRQLHKLFARRIAALSKPGRYSDGGGLYVVLDKAGAKRFVFIFMRHGKQREMGLGSVRSVSLAAAREKAAEARAALGRDEDPIDIKRATRAVGKARRTFGQVADMLIKSKRAEWRSSKHADQWQTSLGAGCHTIWGCPVDEIDTAAVLSVLQPIWSTLPETASRLRGRIEAVLAFARARGWRAGENPAAWRGHLATILPRRQAITRGHYAALAYVELPDFVAELRAADTVASRALTLLILSAGRLGEIRGAEWDEIDLAVQIWTIPANRTKSGLSHRVPLTPMMLDIIGAPDQGFVFPGRNPRRPISAGAIQSLVAKPATVHGMRSAFSDWAHDRTDFAHEIIETALAHKVGTAVSRAYRRTDAIEKRRALMEAWQDFLFPVVDRRYRAT